ncbi:MAG: N-acetyltransferase [Promethearchaeota archaeon]|nr:MAG: N-acetyltransferase [Candidatus Lokiarchaeota archaeon]
MQEVLIIRQPQNRNEFAAMYDLRWHILYKPWDQAKGAEKDGEEQTATHFIAVLHEKVIGTARLHKLNENVAQIKYMVVEESYRGKGIGSKMLEAIHLTAKNQFIKFILLNAPEPAISFFAKYGYKIEEEGPDLFGKMTQKKMLIQFTRSDKRMQQIVNNLKKTLLS